MNASPDTELRRLLRIGGTCGILSVLLYLVAVSLVLPESPSQFQLSAIFLIATGWPLLGVVYSYALYRLIARERQGLANRLGFLFSLFALATVTAMLSVQLVVQAGMHGQPRAAATSELLAALRLVDLGLDLAWDVFLGWSMVLTAIPMHRHSRLGPWWALPSLTLGLLLMGLNVATFPWPPASRGVLDVGPATGLYTLLLSGLLLFLARGKASDARKRCLASATDGNDATVER